MFRNVFSGCVSDRSSQAEVFQCQRLKFGASLSSALKHGFLPGPLVDILVHIAKEGVATADVFRRPGNPNDIRRIVKRLTEGKQVIYSNYSFYTLASVVKKFLLKIPGGVFTVEGEEQLLQVLTVQQKVEQLEIVHHFIESLAPAHQRLVALLFGTWYRIVGYSDINCMSVEALSRSVAGSMFHTCAEDPAKVEKASRIMHFLIDNYGVEDMFGRENIQYFEETTRIGLHIRDLYRYSRLAEPDLIPDLIPSVRSDIIEVTRLDHSEGGGEEEDCDEDGHVDFLGRDRQFSSQSPELSPSIQHSDFSHDPSDPNDSQLMINVSTLSAPEVSLMPSPEVSKRPKSLEDNLNEVRSHYQSRCLSRFNSVKRKQLERLRQRSDWFLSPTTLQSRNNSRKGRGEGGQLSFYTGSNYKGNGGGGGGGPNYNNRDKHYNNNNHHHHYQHHYQHQHRHGSSNPSNTRNTNNNTTGTTIINHPSSLHHHHHPSGNTTSNTTTTFTKASSEGAVLEAFSDGDSVFTDNTSRSESPASEPVWSHILKTHSRDIIHSDTLGHLTLPELSLDRGSSGFDLSLGSQDDLGYSIEDNNVHHQQQEEEEEHGFVGGDRSGAKVVGLEGEEDNPTPTGLHEEEEEEDVTVLATSIPDLNPGSGEDSGGSSKGEETDKDSPSTLCGGASGEEEEGGLASIASSGGGADIFSQLTLTSPTTDATTAVADRGLVLSTNVEGREGGEDGVVNCSEMIPDESVGQTGKPQEEEKGKGDGGLDSVFVPISVREKDDDIDDDHDNHKHHTPHDLYNPSQGPDS